MITDREHCARLAVGIVEHAQALAVAWREEEAAACAPSANPDGPRSGGSPGDPTFGAATRDRRWQDRDRIGAALERAARDLERGARRLA